MSNVLTMPLDLRATQEQRERAKKAPQRITLGELLDKELPERRVLLAPWLRTGESAMIWAPTGVGKSWLALSVALAVAGGGAVLGWRAPGPARVLYVDGEMNAGTVKDRMSRLLASKAIKGLDEGAAKRNLSFDCRQLQTIGVVFWDMLEEVHQDLLVRQLKREGYALAVFDNFTTLSDSLADENSTGAMKPALMLMVKLKAAGIGTILVHHANKGGEQYRGSSSLAATFEVIMGLLKAEDPREDRRNSAGFVIHTEKFREQRDDTMEDRKAFLVGDRWDTEWAVDPKAVRAVAAIKSRQHTTQTEAAEAIGITKGEMSKRLGDAIKLGLTTRAEIEGCLRAAKEARESIVDVFGDEGANPDF